MDFIHVHIGIPDWPLSGALIDCGAGVWYNVGEAGKKSWARGDAAEKGDEALGLGHAAVPMIFGRETRWKSSPTTTAKWC